VADPCFICQGACCESLEFPVLLFAPETIAFLMARGTPLGKRHVEIETRCPSLTDAGRCSCHGSRPAMCREYEVGGLVCRATVLRRRPESAKAIFEAMKTL
jgi:Fe-S-cluster containining protein